MIKDRAKYSSGKVAGITSRLILADSFGTPVTRTTVVREVVPNSAQSLSGKNNMGFVASNSR